MPTDDSTLTGTAIDRRAFGGRLATLAGAAIAGGNSPAAAAAGRGLERVRFGRTGLLVSGSCIAVSTSASTSSIRPKPTAGAALKPCSVA